MVSGVREELLTVFEDGEMLAILIALFHWNPRNAEQISKDVDVSQDIVKKKLNKLTEMGFIGTTGDQYEISEFGKIYVKSLGISKEQLNEKIGKTH